MDLTDTVRRCLAGTSADHPLDLSGLISCIDYHERIIATHEEIRDALLRLRADGVVAGGSEGYWRVPAGAGDSPPFAEPTAAEHEAAWKAYDERMG